MGSRWATISGMLTGAREPPIHGRGARLIVLDPNIWAGKSIIRGTRLSVDFVIGLLANGWSEADILANYPALRRQCLRGCMAYPP